MNIKLRVAMGHLRRAYDADMGDGYGMEFTFQFALPEIQKLVQHREFRGDIKFLPDVTL